MDEPDHIAIPIDTGVVAPGVAPDGVRIIPMEAGSSPGSTPTQSDQIDGNPCEQMQISVHRIPLKMIFNTH